MQTIERQATEVGIGRADLCEALGVPRSSFYRARSSRHPSQRRPRKSPPRALPPNERAEVLATLNSPRFVDRAPAEVAHTLEEEGKSLCSVRTMYRILAANDEVRERRNQRRHPAYAKPELVATAPNQVWSWDITKLKGPSKWTYYYLFVILDIFSRYVVAWMVAEHENANLARRLIRCACQRQGVEPGTLVLHNDRGSPMKANTTTQLVASLGVGHSFSRPRVSNDNPYSESQFKTTKYWPGFPDRFGSITDALEHCREFFPWYNDEHKHSGIVYLTPAHVHYGRAEEVLTRRHQARLEAYRRNPERFVHGPPKASELPREVWINKPAEADGDPAVGRVMTPTDNAGDPHTGTSDDNRNEQEPSPGARQSPLGRSGSAPRGTRSPRLSIRRSQAEPVVNRYSGEAFDVPPSSQSRSDTKGH